MSKQKIKQLLIGTNNKGKLREIRSLLPNYIKIYSTSNFKLKSPAENGKTFEENSLIKSKHFSKKTGLICLADDSGLEIDHLDKRPGIYSARCWRCWKNRGNYRLPRCRQDRNSRDSRGRGLWGQLRNLLLRHRTC